MSDNVKQSKIYNSKKGVGTYGNYMNQFWNESHLESMIN